MKNGDEGIREEFVAEANEHLVQVGDSLAQLAEGSGQEVRAAVQSIFRAVHSIKGCSDYLGLERIAGVCHELESLLNLARNGDLDPTRRTWEVVTEGVALLRAMVEDLDRSEETDIEPFLAEIRCVVRGEARDGEVARLADTPLEVRLDGRPVGIDARLYPVQKALEGGQNLFLLQIDLVRDCDARGRTPPELLEWLNGVGDVLGAAVDPEFVPDVFETGEFCVPFFAVYATMLQRHVVASTADLDPAGVMALRRADDHVFEAGHGADAAAGDGDGAGEETVAEPAAPGAGARSAEAGETRPPEAAEGGEAARDGEAGAGDGASAPGAGASGGRSVPPAVPRRAAGPPRQARSCQGSIRVGVELLDRLMRLAGELVLSRNELAQAIEAGDMGAIEPVTQRLSVITTGLQETIVQTRMQPAGTLFHRFPRLVRDLAEKTGKLVELVVEGTDVEVDRTVIEAIVDPLTHIIRNALDHGVETPEEREAAGKPPTGLLVLRACHEGGQVLIEVRDDGRGIDAARVREKAIDLGVVERSEALAMAPREVLNLIFHPGLSTARKVTKISGRGVGMDVVMGNLERIGGTVDVMSEPGGGTTFLIKLPLTLAILPSLIVRCGRTYLAVPQENVRDLVRVRPDGAPRIETVKGAEVLRRRDGLLPLVRLHPLFRTETQAGGSAYVVVVRAGAREYGLVVDELADSREIVVKPLGRHLKGSPLFVGATVLGDGRIALILDVTALVEHCHLIWMDGESEGEGGTADDGAAALGRSLLVFRSPAAPKEPFALPLEAISRVEEVRPDEVQLLEGRPVLPYGDRPLPLGAVDGSARVAPRPPGRRCYAIVLELDGVRWGVLAEELWDGSDRLRPLQPQGPLPAGIAEIGSLRGEIVRILDPARVTAVDADGLRPDPGGGAREVSREAAVAEVP